MGFTPITLPRSGEVVLIQAISPFLLNKFKRKYPPPAPPIQRVNLGTEERPIWEESVNESHPDYLAARLEWGQMLEERVRRFTLSLGTKIEWSDEKREQLAQLRKGVTDAGEDLIEEDDNFAYISYIAIQTGEDYQFLLKAILEGSRPSEEAIAEAVETFRPVADGQSANL